jgi:membrane-associated phospholipid phosphatase
MLFMKRSFLIIFLFIATTAPAQNLDIEILRQIHTPEALPSDNFFRFVTESNSEVIVALPITLGVISLINKDERMFGTAVELVAANALNTYFTFAMKYSIDRDRPYETYPDIRKKSFVNDASFPSGHTSSSFATATTLSLEYRKWYVVIPAYTWAGTVAYSRMHLGVHYPSDILGGIITGVGSSYITYKANKWLKSKYGKKRLPE